MDSLISKFNYNVHLKSKIKYDKLNNSMLSTNKNIINKIKFGNNMIIKLLIMYLIDLILPVYILFFIDFHSSNITLKIKGTGEKNIFSNQFSDSYYPNYVYINEEIQNNVKYSYNLEEEYNIVVLVWNSWIDDCHNMFDGCPDIYELNFSSFEHHLLLKWAVCLKVAQH